MTMTGTSPGTQSLSLLLLRCIIGLLLFAAGSGKLLGLFGGYGLQASLQAYLKMGISSPFSYLSIFTEFIGGMLLALGLFTRPAAFAVMINMLVATIISLPRGIMGPMGAQTPLIFLVIDIAILLSGPGSISIDSLIFKKK
jgi:putative oxidoreductase